MDFTPEGPKAIPLWIDGRAYLTVTDTFFDVVSPTSGEAIRRVPLGGADEAATAVAAARRARPVWTALAPAERGALLVALADGLERYAGHFAKLLREECGGDEAAASGEVAEAIASLRAGPEGNGVLAGLVVDASRPLAGFAAIAAPMLRGGSVLVAKPSPRAPGAVLALCELTSRTGWPAGVVNVVHGDAAAISGLCAAGIERLSYSGEAALGQQVAAIATAAGVPCEIQVR